jgi:hypothetical protein
MHRISPVALALFLAVLGQAPSSSAQEITVRLIDTRSGRVFANTAVKVYFAPHQMLEEKTGIDGVVKFHLPQPPPSKVSVRPQDDLTSCSTQYPIDTQQIFGEGLISRCSKKTEPCRCKFGRRVSKLKNNPGELVLLARPRDWWEKFQEWLFRDSDL